MAEYEEDFSDQGVGLGPDFFDENWLAPDQFEYFKVEEGNYCFGGKYLRTITKENADHVEFTDTSGQDLEILTLVKFEGFEPIFTGALIALHLRATWVNPNFNGYRVLVTQDNAYIYEETDSFPTLIAGPTPHSSDGPDFYDDLHWLRFRINGNDLKFKMWREGGVEPAWDLEITDTTHTGSGSALFEPNCYDPQSCVMDYWAVSDNGETLVVPTATAGDLRVTQAYLEIGLTPGTAGEIRLDQTYLEVAYGTVGEIRLDQMYLETALEQEPGEVRLDQAYLEVAYELAELVESDMSVTQLFTQALANEGAPTEPNITVTFSQVLANDSDPTEAYVTQVLIQALVNEGDALSSAEFMPLICVNN